MAKQEDIDRWQKGKDHWNKWAEKLLEERKAIEKAGKWAIGEDGGAGTDETREWIGRASVYFSGATLDDYPNFEGFVFPWNAAFPSLRVLSDATFCNAVFHGRAVFVGARFSGAASFEGVVFNGGANFEVATFEMSFDFLRVVFNGPVKFDRVEFHGNGYFNLTEFKDETSFEQATFHKDVWFGGKSFEKGVSFRRCKFLGEASFVARRFLSETSFHGIESRGPFSLKLTLFSFVPDFIQSQFSAPVRLDESTIPEAKSFTFKGDKERAARYRSLKRIAVDSLDHVREQDFFASELRERRGLANDDFPVSLTFIFSVFYGLCSDFSRSIGHSVVALVIQWVTFGAVYKALSKSVLECHSWAVNWFWSPERYLSFLHSLPIVGFGRGGKRDQALECLFGSKEAISPGLDILFICQNILSAVLLFLFLLTLRNRFRIK